ncbi:MAG: M23 family metallopeptidase [Patescibacteria group bacterium]
MTVFLSSTVFCYSLPAYAGIFSFLDSFLGTDNASNNERIFSSQNMSLLVGSLSPDSTYGIGGGDITIVNQNALLPDSGPLGTAADIPDAKSKKTDKISLYVVREGDNISQIANMFDVSMNTIRWANNLRVGEAIKPGQIIVILPVSGIRYTVKDGDTPQGIAKKFKVDVDDLYNFNDINPKEKLVAGNIVIVPNGEYIEEEQSNSQTQSSGSKKIVPQNSSTYSGYYLKPVKVGRRSQSYHSYNAVDLADSCGTPVMAAASGDVLISKDYGWNGGYGNYIVLSHPNGTQTLYAHLSKSIVSMGWHIVQGQIIGYIGLTGKTSGCHLHFEVRGARNPF